MQSIGLRHMQLKNACVGSAFLILGWRGFARCAGRIVRKRARGGGTAKGHQSFTRVLIVGISKNFTQRCAFEWSMSQQIASDSTQVFISCDSMTSNDPLTRANIDRLVASNRADAVLTTAVVSMQLGGQQGNSRDTRATPYYQVTGQGWMTGPLGEYGVPVAFVQLETTPSITMLTGNIHVLTKVFETQMRAWSIRWTRTRNPTTSTRAPPASKRSRG